MAEITYENATRHFPGGTIPAVDALDLQIAEGEFMVLVGPSGSGKTTALRMLAGLEDIDDGRIMIGGKDVSGVAPRDRDIAMVFQNYALYPNKTVGENIGFALKMHGVERSERDRRVKEAAALLDIEGLLDRKPKQLSGGQRQRVAMGRAIVREPSAFLMDEPLSNLDAKLRVATRAQIAELQRRLGVTTVYVTHDQVEAMTMGDRVALLKDGKLQQCASPQELYDRPANTFIAGFIGSPPMNLLPAGHQDGKLTIGDAHVEVPEAHRSEVGRLDNVTLGVRPEHLRLAEEGMAGTVSLVEELGAEIHLHVRTKPADGEEVDVVLRTDRHARYRLGETVHLDIPSEHILAFHPESTELLFAPQA